MRPEPYWLYVLRTNVGAQALLLTVAIPVAVVLSVKVLDALDSRPADRMLASACTPAGSAR